MKTDSIWTMPVSGIDKAIPHDIAAMTLGEVGQQGWNILRGHVPLPSPVLKRSAMQHNLKWMQDFTKLSGVSLAPHGKTTMSPQLFSLQEEFGAWGVSVATLAQLTVYYRFGVKQILLANQLIAQQDIQYLLQLIKHDAQLEVLLLVDSLANVKRLGEMAKKANLRRPLNVLLEIGYTGGRTGCRDENTAIHVAKAVKSYAPYLALAGIECYEGLMVSDDAKRDAEKVEKLLVTVGQAAKNCQAEDCFYYDKVLLTAGGSAYFDIVARSLVELTIADKQTEVIIRSGCYLIHDSGFYDRLLDAVKNRLGDQWDWQCKGRLKPALEVWSQVQSCPEANLAILTMGKRDASYDIDLPKPQQWFSPGKHKQPEAIAEGYELFAMNDHHAYLRRPENCQLEVGDMIACGISHPCTTFDKWQTVLVVDDSYNVVSAVKTFF